MKDKEMRTLRSIATETYKMETTEYITATALKCYLLSLIENGEEEQAKTELKTAVKPKLFSTKKSDITKFDSGVINPEMFDTIFDICALTDLLDKAYRYTEKCLIEKASPYSTIGEGMRNVDGKCAMNHVGYAFIVFFVDCYKALCG